jgi:hypothetical protein
MLRSGANALIRSLSVLSAIVCTVSVPLESHSQRVSSAVRGPYVFGISIVGRGAVQNLIAEQVVGPARPSAIRSKLCLERARQVPAVPEMLRME